MILNIFSFCFGIFYTSQQNNGQVTMIKIIVPYYEATHTEVYKVQLQIVFTVLLLLHSPVRSKQFLLSLCPLKEEVVLKERKWDTMLAFTLYIINKLTSCGSFTHCSKNFIKHVDLHYYSHKNLNLSEASTLLSNLISLSHVLSVDL